MEDQIGLYWLVIQRTAACCLPRRSTPLILHGLYDTLPGMVGGIGAARYKTLWNASASHQASRSRAPALPVRMIRKGVSRYARRPTATKIAGTREPHGATA